MSGILFLKFFKYNYLTSNKSNGDNIIIPKTIGVIPQGKLFEKVNQFKQITLINTIKYDKSMGLFCLNLRYNTSKMYYHVTDL